MLLLFIDELISSTIDLLGIVSSSAPLKPNLCDILFQILIQEEQLITENGDVLR